MEHTSHVEQQLHMQGEEGEGGDVETAEDALTRHVQIHDQLRKAPQTTIREGNELLRRLEQVGQLTTYCILKSPLSIEDNTLATNSFIDQTMSRIQ